MADNIVKAEYLKAIDEDTNTEVLTQFIPPEPLGTDRGGITQEEYEKLLNSASEDSISQIKEGIVKKIDKPTTIDNNKFPRAKNGDIEWVEQGLPTDEQTNSAVTNWLNKHPEATTTVQDGAITEEKINVDFLPYIKNDYVSPKMFGAKGDGISDDTVAFQDMFNYVNSTLLPMYIPNGKYLITADLPALFKGFSMYGVPFGNNNKTGSIILDKRENTSIYLLRHDKTIANINGGAIKDIKFISDINKKLFGVYLTGGWDGIITDCTFSGYETALYTIGDEIRCSNCQFVFCGTKEDSDEYNYAVVLDKANEKRFVNCHFEHSRFFVLITDSCWSNHFVNCKFEIGTIYSAINTDKSAIFVDSATANYDAVSFVDCDFHMLDIEYFIEKVGFVSYDSTPFFMKSNNACTVKISNCSFMCGSGSGDTQYKQFSQAKFLTGGYVQMDNCIFIAPSYIVTSINAKNLLMNNCSVAIKTRGEYSVGSYSKDVPIISTEFGKCKNTFFNIMNTSFDKYYRLFNKNFEFVTPRNVVFNRGNELYASTLYIVLDSHQNNFAFPFEIFSANKISGNMYGYIQGKAISWSSNIISALEYKITNGTVTAYIIDTKLVFKLEGYNPNAGSFVNFNIMEELPYDWYITSTFDVSNATHSAALQA